MAFLIISLLNGLSYGLLLFMLSAGLTLVLSMMGVLNLAHASFYMLGAYVGYAVASAVGFEVALVVAPCVVGCLGAWFERAILRRVHGSGHVAELLATWGLAYVLHEVVQLVWGRTALEFQPPAWLRGPVFTWVTAGAEDLQFTWGAPAAEVCRVAMCSPFPATRGFMAVTALVMWLWLWLLLKRTSVGLVVQGSLKYPDMMQALGHNVPRVFMMVFGIGAALAGLAGVLGGSTFVTEPGMAASVGSMVFAVVVVGGMGSMVGALAASLLMGVVQTLAVSMDVSLGQILGMGGLSALGVLATSLLQMKLSQLAPLLPYVMLVAVLLVRPQGLSRGRLS